MSEFKVSRDYLSRKIEVETIKRCWTDKIPLIIEKDKNSKIQELIKPKFLCPIEFSVQQFLIYLRKKINLPRRSALFVATEKGEILSGDKMMIDVYMREKDEDGFLYLRYGEHSAFG